MDRIEDIKERILQSSIKLFMEHGYRNTSIRMIGQESHISHTQVIYHFAGKTNIGKQVVQNYFQLLIRLVTKHSKRISGDEKQVSRLLWWSYHYLILTSFNGFSRFYLEFITDESEAFFGAAKPILIRVYHDMFGLTVDLRNKSLLADFQLLSGVDMVLTRMCINKTLKVREAIHKLLRLEILDGFSLPMTEEDIESFLLENQILDVIAELDEMTFCNQ